MNSVTYTTRDLTFGYGQTTVLHDLDLTFEPGLFHAIVGPNGSGKSTLLDLLGGHRLPSSGEVAVNDTEVARYPTDQLSRLTALVPQEISFNFPFTVFDAVLMGRHPHIPRFARPGEDDLKTVHAAMTTMDIVHLRNRPLSELSGGEKQRTVLARALAQATPCLLLDEPTSSMDIRHALATMDEMRRLAHLGNTIIAVLHDLNLAATFCDRIVVLNQGRVHTRGTPRDALTPDTIATVFGVRATLLQTPGDNLTIIYDSEEI